MMIIVLNLALYSKIHSLFDSYIIFLAANRMNKRLVLVFLTFAIASAANLIYYSQIPVDRLTLFKSMLSMNMLKSQLDSTFGTPSQNKISMYIRTSLT
jgi:hypothetical protein